MAYGLWLTAYGLWLMAYGLWLMAYGLGLWPEALAYGLWPNLAPPKLILVLDCPVPYWVSEPNIRTYF